MTEITVQELKAKKENGSQFILIDVREHFEYLISNLGGRHIVLDELESHIARLETYKHTDVILMCRSGGRSARACELLQRHGFTCVANLKGGIKAWADEIDPDIPVA